MPTITETNPNGSLTDRLFGLVNTAVDTVGQIQVAKAQPPPAPSTPPKIKEPEPALPPASDVAGGQSSQTQLFIGGTIAIAAVVIFGLLAVRRRKL